jgi:ferredoxin
MVARSATVPRRRYGSRREGAGRRYLMTYVITEACIGTKDASCVEACPVDCIHSTDADPQYYIDPETCIDCGACEPVCPVNAIYSESDVPAEYRQYIQINADYFKK